jgi:hypothetical protein
MPAGTLADVAPGLDEPIDIAARHGIGVDQIAARIPAGQPGHAGHPRPGHAGIDQLDAQTGRAGGGDPIPSQAAQAASTSRVTLTGYAETWCAAIG